MERVLNVYKRPYDSKFPIVCMDESPKQLIEEAKPSVNIFMANEPLKGKRFVKVTEQKTKRDQAINAICANRREVFMRKGFSEADTPQSAVHFVSDGPVPSTEKGRPSKARDQRGKFFLDPGKE